MGFLSEELTNIVEVQFLFQSTRSIHYTYLGHEIVHRVKRSLVPHSRVLCELP